MIAAIVLAAGRGSRMGANKLLAELSGEPLVRHAVKAARAVAPVTVVTGHEADTVRAVLTDLDVTIVHNPAFATGMASSLRVGISAVEDADAALVCLGDMPRVTAQLLSRIVAAFDGGIVVPTCDGNRGNPVLWARRYFAEISGLDGDVGARTLLERHAAAVRWLDVADRSVLLDVDTPDALARIRSE